MPRPTLLPCLFAAWILAAALPAQVILSEWMASNRDTMTDRDGAAADWIELHNTSTAAADLAGYFLTDTRADLTRYRLPTVTIPGRGYLVVFASGKDRRDPGAALHTNFRIGKGGGELLLVKPDGRTIQHAVRFGKQQTDVSQGFRQSFRTTVVLPEDAPARLYVPRSSRTGKWRDIGYDDAKWFAGQGGFGFDHKTVPTLGRWIKTDVARHVRRVNSTIYYRFPIDIAELSAFDACVLRVRSVSGFAAYVNGREVARRRAPRSMKSDSAANVAIEPRDPARPDAFAIQSGLFRQGRNILAVHALTDAPDTREHLLEVEIRGYQTDAAAVDRILHFTHPSPGRPNGEGSATIARRPKIEPASQLFEDMVQVTLTPRDSTDVLRYTLDGSLPTGSSPAYEGPLTIRNTMRLRARAFRPGAVPSPTAHGVYTQLHGDLQEFRSNLPLIVLSTFGRPVRPKEFETAQVHAVDATADRRSSLRNPPAYAGFGAIKTRGSSTLERPKKAYGLELRTSSGADRRVSFLGMPKDADWVLYGPHNFDQAHLRNALCYEIARRMGLDAPRTRFVEVFVNEENRPVRRSDYRGLYILTERISPGKGRVDLQAPALRAAAPEELSGGYILKIDRPGPGDMGFLSGELRLQFVYPKERDITDPQRAWLQSHFDRFQTVLAGPDAKDPQKGYRAFIDVDNFIDFHFFHEYTKNPDAFTLSTYLHKKRGGPIRMGPVWDFDRAMRTNAEDYWVGRPARPTGWTSDSGHGFWIQLFADPAFQRRYRERSREHLRSTLAVERIHALVDALAAEIAEAEDRDRQRWPIIDAGGWENEILALKDWIRERTAWLQTKSVETPTFHSSTGRLSPPLVLTIRSGMAGAELFYTLDGADPRLSDGSLSPRARRYTGPLQIDGETRVQVRLRSDGVWSHIAWATITSSLPELTFSEVMYNPEGGRHYEFIEILNYGKTPVDLRGLKITGAARFYFTLGDIHELAPGARVVVVRDLQRFADRYGREGIPVAGKFLGKMDNTQGELRLTGPIGQRIARAVYEDGWYPKTDGKGYSLEASGSRRIHEQAKDWRPGTKVFGTPGK